MSEGAMSWLRARWPLTMPLLLCAVLCGCGRQEGFPARPITIICPWAAGGGTDRVSRQMALQLERALGVPVSVVNATGGKGVTGHNRGLRARPDGYTLTMMTFELNTMHWIGLTDLTHADCRPLLSLNEDYAALLLRKDASWQNITELEAAIRDRPQELTASGTAVGGAWHLALAGWLHAAGLGADDVTWVPSAGANPSLQQLMSGGVDMVCCSLPEARTLLEAGEVRALGVMSPQRAVGFEEVPTFVEQGRDWTLGGWRGLGLPKETPQDVVDQLADTVEAIVSQSADDPNSFAHFMQQQKFDNTWRRGKAFVQFLDATDAKLGELLTSEAMKSVRQDRFSANAYPRMLAVFAGLSLLGIVVGELRRGRGAAVAETTKPQWTKFLLIVCVIVAYVALVEAVGFHLIAGAVVLTLLLALGNRLVPSLLIAALFVPAVFFLFAQVLRVPLPRGWWG